MGKENNFKAGVTSQVQPGSNGLTTNAYSVMNKSGQGMRFGIVTAINLTTKEITYNIIEDNVGAYKAGKALPLYPNQIQIPDIGYVVPLVIGPANNVGVISNAKNKSTYYMDPIGIWQTVNDNKIVRTNTFSPSSPSTVVNKLNINTSEIGIPNE
jgi:hypothetical protein